jgi:hypothetical protein
MMLLVVPLYFYCVSFGFDLCKVEEHLETEKDGTAEYSCNSIFFRIFRKP